MHDPLQPQPQPQPTSAAPHPHPATQVPHFATTHIIYALFTLGLFTAWFGALLGVVMVYVIRDDVKGTYLESHMNWLIATFWWGVLWSAIAWLLLLLIVGWFGPSWVIFFVAWVWGIYRVARGWLKLLGYAGIDA